MSSIGAKTYGSAAAGKALLAFLDEERREEVLSGPLEAATEKTIVNPEKHRKELNRVHKRGFAFSFAERVPGISTLAVPVRDHTDTVLASLSVSGPSTRLPEKRLLELVPIAQRAALALSVHLGYQEN